MISQDGLGFGQMEHVRRGLALSERRLLLGAGDLAVVGIAFLAAFNVHSGPVRGLGFSVPRVALGITLAVYLVSAQLVDAYRLSGTVNMRGTFRAVAGSMSISFIGLLLVFFIAPYRITRPTLLIWVGLATAGLLAWRIAYRSIFAGEIFAGSLAVVAQKGAFDRIWPDATGVMRGLYRIVEVVDPALPECGDILRELVAEGRINQIILGVRDDVDRGLFKSLIDCYDHGVPVRSLNDLYEELTGRLMLDQLGHSWLISLPMRSETSRLYAGFKRGVDIASGLTGLVVLAVILPLAALAIKINSRGPVLYRQPRLGHYGRPFQILKLRTMTSDGGSGGGERQTDARDARVTGVGRVLRRFHLDELPQGWNIVKGDMSLIGPRPEQPAYVAMLQREIDFYNTRLSVRPGLTGWAQINYGYGAGVAGAREKLSYDLYYIKRQSAPLDLLILARTFVHVLSVGAT